MVSTDSKTHFVTMQTCEKDERPTMTMVMTSTNTEATTGDAMGDDEEEWPAAEWIDD